MRRTGFTQLLIASVIVSLLGSLALSSCGNTVSNNAYDYPLRPGMEGWRSLAGYTAMVSACQIPQNTIEHMSTMALVASILDYPLMMDFWVHNLPQEGFDVIMGEFNGLQELFKRDDAGTALLEQYASMDLAAIDANWPDSQKVDYCFKINTAEMIMSQPCILSTMDQDEMHSIVNEAISKVEAKSASALCSKWDTQASAWLIGRTLEQADYTPFVESIAQDNNVRYFLTTGFGVDDINNILAYAHQFVAVNET